MQLPLFAETEMTASPKAPPPERDTVFYAVLLGPQLWLPASRLVAAQRDRHGLTGRLRTTDNFHIPVLDVGFADELTDADIRFAQTIGGEISFEPFELSFTDLLSVDLSRKPSAPAAFALAPRDGSQILGLGDRLAAAMLSHGVRPHAVTSQMPHVTLLYDAVRVAADAACRADPCHRRRFCPRLQPLRPKPPHHPLAQRAAPERALAPPARAGAPPPPAGAVAGAGRTFRLLRHAPARSRFVLEGTAQNC